jgi:hypothetical protein
MDDRQVSKQALPNDGHAQALTLANTIISILGEGGDDQASRVAATINAYAAKDAFRAVSAERRRIGIDATAKGFPLTGKEESGRMVVNLDDLYAVINDRDMTTTYMRLSVDQDRRTDKAATAERARIVTFLKKLAVLSALSDECEAETINRVIGMIEGSTYENGDSSR